MSAAADPPVYRGRFAPSPSGPLHAGSVVAAVASFLDARANAGRWLVRIDDLDRPRTQPGAAAAILAELERLALIPDEAVWYQSQRGASYADALDRLRTLGHTFDCGCTRREVGGGAYPGTCRRGLPAGRQARAVRVKVSGPPVTFVDRLAGVTALDLISAPGDFIVRRADGITAYHLATVVDDAAQGVTDIVRGADLLDSTPPQIWLQRLLGLPQPRYAHVPVVTNALGQKLSKQSHAPATAGTPATTIWLTALTFLGIAVPPTLRGVSLQRLQAFAVEAWRERLPKGLCRS